MSDSKTAGPRKRGMTPHRWMLASFGVLTILAVALAHTGGFIVAVLCWLIYGFVRLWVWIFTRSTRGIAKIHAQEQAREQERIRREQGEPPGNFPSGI